MDGLAGLRDSSFRLLAHLFEVVWHCLRDRVVDAGLLNAVG